jgi:cystathionine beta-lyase
LPSDPGHALWKRDFRGSCGLFAIELQPCPRERVRAFIDALELFSLGFSWGGYESLVVPAQPGRMRTVRPWQGGPLVRLHVGLEDPEDLRADLERGLARLA